jgi:uncharacterized protein
LHIFTYMSQEPQITPESKVVEVTTMQEEMVINEAQKVEQVPATATANMTIVNPVEDVKKSEIPSSTSKSNGDYQYTSEQRTIAILTHLGGIMFGFVPSLVVYLIQEKEGFVKENAKSALNFQISIIIYAAICFVLTFILIGILGFMALGVFLVVMPIIAAIKTSDGKVYQYPLTINLIK